MGITAQVLPVPYPSLGSAPNKKSPICFEIFFDLYGKIGSVDNPVLWSPSPLPIRRNEDDKSPRWRIGDG